MYRTAFISLAACLALFAQPTEAVNLDLDDVDGLYSLTEESNTFAELQPVDGDGKPAAKSWAAMAATKPASTTPMKKAAGPPIARNPATKPAATRLVGAGNNVPTADYDVIDVHPKGSGGKPMSL